MRLVTAVRQRLAAFKAHTTRVTEDLRGLHALRDHHNNRQLRAGDRICWGKRPRIGRLHKNQWLPAGCLSSAYAEVGHALTYVYNEVYFRIRMHLKISEIFPTVISMWGSHSFVVSVVL
jgi:hypothetical protein